MIDNLTIGATTRCGEPIARKNSYPRSLGARMLSSAISQTEARGYIREGYVVLLAIMFFHQSEETCLKQ